MRHLRITLLLSGLCMLLFFSLYQINIHSRRMDASLLSPDILSNKSPVLLSGGQLLNGQDGSQICQYSFHWEDNGCLYLPHESKITINGTTPSPEDSYRGNVYPLPTASVPSGNYTVCVFSDQKIFPLVTSLYFGTYSQIMEFVNTSISCNYFILGLCFTIALFSMILFLFKKSERYLFWLSMLACFAGSYYLLAYLFIPITRILPFFSWLSLSSNLYFLLHQLLVATLQHKVMYCLVPEFRPSFPNMPLCALASVPCVLLSQNSQYFNLAILLFFIALYSYYLFCFQKYFARYEWERFILLIAWMLTSTARLFDQLCEIGAVPSGDVNLRLRFRGIISCIYVVAFFLVTCKRFAQKFEEADRLNSYLEVEIDRKTKNQTVFIRSMLHNLKSPLFSLSGYMEIAEKVMKKQPQEAKKYMEKAHEKAVFAGRLMDSIFFATQLEAGLVQFQEMPVNLCDILRAAIETAQVQSASQPVAWEISLPPLLPFVGDPLYLQQVFQNLLDNALNHTPEKGHITVAAQIEKEFFVVRISDNGCGISPEELPVIFDAYYSNRHGKANSSGLGLFISRQIIQKYGGNIRAESTPGQGAHFIVELPASK